MSNINVLVVEDDVSLRDAIVDALKIEKINVKSENSAEDAIQRISTFEADVVLTDLCMGGEDGLALVKRLREQGNNVPVIVMTAFGSVNSAISAMKLGTTDYLLKPFDIKNLIEKIKQCSPAAKKITGGYPISVSQISKAVFDNAKKVAKTSATVLLTGESGVGKDVFAKYIHENSDRKSKPFVAINCAAIPENMLEPTLFGYEKGAFTGAYKSTSGKFEQAQGGTLLLDEISEMALELQAKVLRVIQESEVERVGGKQVIDLDVRIIATSNRNLLEEVREGRFREDLYYRLNVFPIKIPSLRERKEDIVPLAKFFIKKHGDNSVEFTDAACEKLLIHNWSGNIRELDNVVQRALILASNKTIDADSIVLDTNSTEEVRPSVSMSSGLQSDIKMHEYDLIQKTLNDTKGCRKAAAEKLGISPRTLRYKIAKLKALGLELPKPMAAQS